MQTIDRTHVCEQLSQSWRRQVDILTDLAVRRHSINDTDPRLAHLVAELDAELAAGRQRLVDIETELQGLDSRGYGRCGP